MDLIHIERVVAPACRAELPALGEGAAFLAGGTWLFSEPQPGLRTLIDLQALGWPALEPSASGLRIGATCTIAELAAFEAPGAWRAAAALAGCCNALLGSFKIWNTATVGGNVCLALPAAPMLALTVALDGVARIWPADGSERSVPMAGFATGAQRTVLRPGEVLRAIDLPEPALRRRVALRQASLTAYGRSAALLLATLDADGGFALTVTGSTIRPVHASWPSPPSPGRLDHHVAGLPAELWLDDVHGAPDWRRHMTRRLAAELLQELAS